MRICAIIMVRDSVKYVDYCLNHLFNNNIEVAVIDHGSTDGTYEACEKYLSHGLCHLSREEYLGYFSLKDQLIVKQQLVQKLPIDWVIHQDIDECLESPLGNKNILYDSIVKADRSGFNAINFHEFVFLPIETKDFITSSYYYFFEPFYPRLMRGWKKSANLSSLDSGGHTFTNDFNLYPEDFVLKHYIFTSQEHAISKYRERDFSESELNEGWHLNRVSIDKNKLIFPGKEVLDFYNTSSNIGLNTSKPWKKHYWDQI